MKQKIAVLGAGLVGPLLSILLVKEGFQVDVFEKRANPLKNDAGSGRSINLALSYRGIQSLKLAGVFDRVKELLIPMLGRSIHTTEGQSFQNYGTTDQYINSVSRLALNQLLIKEAIDRGVNFHFDTEVIGIDYQKTLVTLANNQQHAFDVIFGADGAFSSMRKQFIQDKMHFETTEEVLDYGYKELSIPPKNNDFVLTPNALHIWPRRNFMLIALPNLDKSFTCTLFLPFKGKVSFEQLQKEGSLISFFNTEFKDVMGLIPNLVYQFSTNPTSTLQTIRSFPWAFNECLLIGDAAHAIVPFYGQGMNAGFEDCKLLMEIAKENNFDWKVVFQHFQTKRKPDADAIADLANQNFIEMRDKVLDARFRKQKALEEKLHLDFPEIWNSQYSMVSFSDTPYRQAKKIGEFQQKFIDSLGDFDLAQIDTAQIIQLFNKSVKDVH